MKITELIKKDTIILELENTKKEDVLNELINKLDNSGRLNDKEEYKKEILKREAEGTTGIGEGVAIPHAKTKAVNTPSIAFARSKKGIDFDSLDGEPTFLFFMIAASEGAHQDHLKTLQKLSTFLMDENFRKQLLIADTKEEILDIIDKKQIEKEELENEKQEFKPKTEEKREKLLAVTACPTGIAHTYMAADALKAKAEKMNVDIKVETNGSTGVENRLTDEEIKEAKAIIVSADTKVDMNRFDGKVVIETPVSDAIKQPGALIERALVKDGNIYKAKSDSKTTSSEDGGVAKGIYRNLMNGVSNMLPFVVGGGILIVGTVMNFFIVPPVEWLNTGMNSWLAGLGGANKLLLGLLLGGMMAVDMGGPVNKAAYVFGVASVAEGNGHIMAAVMAGGMVPPLGIALATTFFKDRFTENERDAGKTNYVMGLSFITEGAIPFAAADPKSVIPSIIAGSAVAGGLSAMFGASSPAPHGGIFVFPVVTNWLLYIVAILIGSIVTALLLKALKKPVELEEVR